MASLSALSNVSDPTTSTIPGVFNSFFGPDPFSLFCVILLTSLGTWGLPQMVQKFYAIKSEQSISKGTIISTLFALVVAGGCYFLGGFGRLFSTPEKVAETGFDAIIPTMLENLPTIIIAIVIVLVLSASMSTLSSLVLTSSSTLTLDFLKNTVAKNMDDKKQLIVMRGLIVVFITISVVIAIVQYKSNVTFIAQLMGVSWGALAGAFLAPFLYGLYMKRTSKAAVWFCFFFGTGVMTLNLFFRPLFPVVLQSPINCGAFAMIAGLIIVPLISLFTKAPKKEVVEDCFASYEETVTVKVKTSLKENIE